MTLGYCPLEQVMSPEERESVLGGVAPKADPEARIPVIVTYLGGDLRKHEGE